MDTVYTYTTLDDMEFTDYDEYKKHESELETGTFDIIDNEGGVYSHGIQGYYRTKLMLADWISHMLEDGMTQKEIDDLELIIV